MQGIFEVTVPLLRQVVIKEKKVSVSAQTFYAQMNAFSGNALADKLKRHIADHIRASGMAYSTYTVPVVLLVEVNPATLNFDMDNIGFIWQKTFLDAVKRVDPLTKEGKLKKKRATQYLSKPLLHDDSVKHVSAPFPYLGSRKDGTLVFRLVPNIGNAVVDAMVKAALTSCTTNDGKEKS